VLHRRANAEHRRESGHEKAHSDSEVRAERREHDVAQSADVRYSDIADAGEGVPLDLAESEDRDRLYGRDGPRDEVKVVGVVLDGFVGPLEAGRHEPGQR